LPRLESDITGWAVAEQNAVYPYYPARYPYYPLLSATGRRAR
jgi:hypothetical protein